MTKIVIVGCGGLGKEVLMSILDCNNKSKKYEILGFLDDERSLWGKKINNFKVLGGSDWLTRPQNKSIRCVIAIGDGKTRKRIVQKLKKSTIKFSTIIHPSVILSKNSVIGNGTIIQAGSVINSDVEIGNHCKIDTNCTIAHDCKIGDFVTVSPGTNINGANIIHEGASIGSGTNTIEDIIIGKWSTIGAGTVLIKNVKSNSVYVGVPGKLKKKLKRIAKT